MGGDEPANSRLSYFALINFSSWFSRSPSSIEDGGGRSPLGLSFEFEAMLPTERICSTCSRDQVSSVRDLTFEMCVLQRHEEVSVQASLAARLRSAPHLPMQTGALFIGRVSKRVFGAKLIERT